MHKPVKGGFNGMWDGGGAAPAPAAPVRGCVCKLYNPEGIEVEHGHPVRQHVRIRPAVPNQLGLNKKGVGAEANGGGNDHGICRGHRLTDSPFGGDGQAAVREDVVGQIAQGVLDRDEGLGAVG